MGFWGGDPVVRLDNDNRPNAVEGGCKSEDLVDVSFPEASIGYKRMSKAKEETNLRGREDKERGSGEEARVGRSQRRKIKGEAGEGQTRKLPLCLSGSSWRPFVSSSTCDVRGVLHSLESDTSPSLISGTFASSASSSSSTNRIEAGEGVAVELSFSDACLLFFSLLSSAFFESFRSFSFLLVYSCSSLSAA